MALKWFILFSATLLVNLITVSAFHIIHEQGNGGIKLGNKKYRVIRRQANFFEAMEYCAKQNMQLATVNSKEENDHLQKLAGDAGYPVEGRFWVSGSNLGNKDKFVWMTTGESVGENYSNWGEGQPDNFNGKEQCLEIITHPKLSVYQWNDHVCDGKKYFICECSSSEARNVCSRYGSDSEEDTFRSLLEKYRVVETKTS